MKMIVIKVRELNDFYQAYRMSATYLRSPTDPNSGRSISFCDFAYLEQDPSRMDCTMIYRFSRCQMPIRGPALYHNSPANVNRAALNLHQPIIPSRRLIPPTPFIIFRHTILSLQCKLLSCNHWCSCTRFGICFPTHGTC